MSDSTAAKTPQRTDSMHPVPVTCVIRELPPETFHRTVPFEMKSSEPEISTAVFSSRDRRSVRFPCWTESRAAGLSTPCDWLSRWRRALASPGLTRSREGVKFFSSSSTRSSRQGLAPTPTGSKTTGCPSF